MISAYGAQQVAKTTKALASVSKMVGNGNLVVFDEGGSFIYNKATGETTWMREENGVYLLDVMVAPAAWKPDDGVPEEVVRDITGQRPLDGSQPPFGGPVRERSLAADL